MKGATSTCLWHLLNRAVCASFWSSPTSRKVVVMSSGTTATVFDTHGSHQLRGCATTPPSAFRCSNLPRRSASSRCGAPTRSNSVTLGCRDVGPMLLAQTTFADHVRGTVFDALHHFGCDEVVLPKMTCPKREKVFMTSMYVIMPLETRLLVMRRAGLWLFGLSAEEVPWHVCLQSQNMGSASEAAHA